MNCESILRGLPCEEKIFRNQKRVRVLKAADCIVALSKLQMDTKQIKEEIQKLLDSYKLVRVKSIGNGTENVDLHLSKTLGAGDLYMWSKDKRDYFGIFVTLLVILFVFFLAMIRLWPSWMKSMVGYIKDLVMILIGLLLATGVVRLIIYCITYFTHSPSLWIFPNLFEECGVLESFKPLYCWANENVSPKKNSE